MSILKPIIGKGFDRDHCPIYAFFSCLQQITIQALLGKGIDLRIVLPINMSVRNLNKISYTFSKNDHHIIESQFFYLVFLHPTNDQFRVTIDFEETYTLF